MAFDPLFSRVMEFGKNKRPESGLSNLYVAQTIDQDGNVTSETYGMNTFTNYGFARFFYNNDAWPHQMYIGRGNEVGSFSFLQDPHLIEPITTACDNSRNTTIDYKYPMYFYDAGNLATCVCKFQVSTFNEVVDGISDDVSIYEYGIGSAINQLWTHSWVYDISGAQTFITKHMNEKLVITVYFCMTYNISLITNGWNEGRYTVITTLEKFLGTRTGDVNMTESNAGIYQRYNRSHAYGRTFTRSMLSDNQITKYTNLNDFNILNQTGTNNGYLDGFYNKTSGFLTIEPQVLSTPETFDIVVQNQYDDFYSTAFADLMGRDVSGYQMPFTQANIQHMYLYNRHTRSYSTEIPFINDPNRWYDESPMMINMQTPIYYTNRDEIMTAYVYQNTHTEDDIIGFTNTNIGMLYGTNAYWNRGEWVLITTRNTIPQNVRNMRYYITDSDTNSLQPIRASQQLTVKTGDNQVDTTIGFDTFTNGTTYLCCSNYDEGYFVQNNTVYNFDHTVSFVIGSNLSNPCPSSWTNVVNATHYCYGNRIITTTNERSNQIYITNTSTPSTMYSIMMDIYNTADSQLFNTSINVFTQAYKTESKTGLLGLQGTNQNKFVVLDMSRLQDGSSENILYHRGYNAYMGCAIYSTNNKKQAVYVSSDDHKIHLVDYSDENPVELDIFDLPATIVDSSITLMFGLNDYFWISNGTYCYRYHITNRRCVVCSGALTLISNKTDTRYVMITAVNDVIMLWRYNNLQLTQVYYFRLDESDDDTITAYNLTDFDISINYTTIPLLCQLEYLENNTLLLFIECTYSYSGTWKVSHIIDFGQWLDPPDGSTSRVKSDMVMRNNSKPLAMHPFGKYFIIGNKKVPMIYTMPTRIIGTTKTHSAVNNVKHISGKQWSITVSNIAPDNYGDSGYPPGSLN